MLRKTQLCKVLKRAFQDTCIKSITNAHNCCYGLKRKAGSRFALQMAYSIGKYQIYEHELLVLYTPKGDES